MVRIESTKNGKSIDTEVEFQGVMKDVIFESSASVKALYENLYKKDPKAARALLTIVGEMVANWIDEDIDGILSEMFSEAICKDGDTYA